MKNEKKKIARLIKQIQHGNQSAFEEFYKMTSSKAYFIALKITQNEQDAEDILQDSYIKALEKINEIDTSQNVTSWFLKIVSNKSKDLLKSRTRLVFDGEEENSFVEIPEEKTEFCPEENLNQEELRLEVMAAIDELTAEKRACIMMMYFGDMSVKEIAESIEVPESTVKNRLYTARRDLKDKFEKRGNVLYGAAIGGVLIWALNKTSVTASASFAASTASTEILSGIGASGAVSSAAAATGTGIAAKAAALSVAQKVVIGVTAAGVIGGGTAGIVSIVNTEPETTKAISTTVYTEQISAVPSQTSEYVFVEFTTAESTTEAHKQSAVYEKTTTETKTTQKREPTATTSAVTASRTEMSETTTEESATLSTTEKRTRPTTTRRDYSLYTSATTTQTTTEQITAEETTTRRQRTTTTEVSSTPTTKQTTTVTETEEETTLTTTQTTTEPTTETTTETTTQAPATVNVEVVDMNEDVVATFSFTVEAGTEMTWEYLVTQIKAKGYEPMAGIYGDAVGAVAQANKTYNITAEL